jgi:Protein of unknown function (DUF3089)
VARKFLYIIAVLVFLAIAAAFTYRMFGTQLMRAAFVPNSEFSKPVPQLANAYSDPKRWVARPDKPGNPSAWLPKGVEPGSVGRAAVFFIHPTSYISYSKKADWNAAFDDSETNARTDIFVRGQASVFSAAGDIWAPRYRQANFAAFLTEKPEGHMALDAAYDDVATAFDAFVAGIDSKRPIILAGHSQGALHLTTLLRRKIARTPLAKRIVAAYVIGWPVSATTDLAALGLPACQTPDQSGCLLSWQSFADPADPDMVTQAYESTTGFDGHPREGTPMVCTNPLTGANGGTAPMQANLGTLRNKADFSDGELVKAAVPAKCDARGFLMIGDPPEMGPYVLPGNNYHVYDYSLFWANIRADAVRRLAGFGAR